MAGYFDALLRLASPMMEAGLTGADSALRTTSSFLGRLAGEPPAASGAPVDGPADVDAATAELSNRLLRTALHTSLTPSSLAEAGREAFGAVLGSLPLRDPRQLLTLPFRLPLAWASLATQEGLRALAAAQVVPVERMADFLDFVVETFTDLHVYFSLQYREEIERWSERVRRDPDDARARLELGRTYLKCGLFEEAARELRLAAREPRLAGRALYNAMVAAHRAGDYAAAIRDGVGCLDRDGGDERARYWLWLTAQETGGYPPEVPPALRMEARDGYHPTPVELADVAAEIGLDKTSGGRGTAVADFHGDGHLDVVVSGAHAGCSFYRNNGDGTFTDVSTGSGLDRCVYGFAVAAGDYNNDGRPDLFISSLGFFNGWSTLMRNNGVGADGRVTFTDVTEEAGLKCWGPGFTATWVDYDGDGWLDLFLANNLGGLFDRKTPNRLFRNNRDGTFTEVTEEAGLATIWPTIGAAWGDFSNNGLPDLFVNGLGRGQLFRNNGGGADGIVTFTDVSREAGVDAPVNGSVAIACDVDDDGWLDIVQLTYSRPHEAIYTLRHGEGPADGSPLRVWRNNRDGTFTDVARDLGITGCWGTMSAAVGDFDNDGHQDLFLGNGDPGMDRTEASVLLANDGRGTFRNVSFAAGLPFTGKGHGANMADLAGDGRLHLLMASGGLYPGDLQTTAVYRPREVPGHYLNVRLVGSESNRDAIGARLALQAGGRWQHRLVSGGSGFGCLPCEQHFGLGRLTGVEALEVRWPSGRRQRWEALPIDATIRITEGKAGWEDVYRPTSISTTEE